MHPHLCRFTVFQYNLTFPLRPVETVMRWFMFSFNDGATKIHVFLFFVAPILCSLGSSRSAGAAGQLEGRFCR